MKILHVLHVVVVCAHAALSCIPFRPEVRSGAAALGPERDILGRADCCRDLVHSFGIWELLYSETFLLNEFDLFYYCLS